MPDRCVIWIDTDIATTAVAKVDAEKLCVEFARSKGLSVSIALFGSGATTHGPWGTVHEALRCHDAAAIVVPSIKHIHLDSARRLAAVYAAESDQHWRWGSTEKDKTQVIINKRLLSNATLFAVGFLLIQQAVKKRARRAAAPSERAGRMGYGISPITDQG